ncbi:hypothetical protein HYV49_04820 [Candidatus Pacearchaeota archaeon]|nr:hypothetical protein [Candidatus Pacearchaeota archaeon]
MIKQEERLYGKNISQFLTSSPILKTALFAEFAGLLLSIHLMNSFIHITDFDFWFRLCWL